jgi:hypothetical protein
VAGNDCSRHRVNIVDTRPREVPLIEAERSDAPLSDGCLDGFLCGLAGVRPQSETRLASGQQIRCTTPRFCTTKWTVLVRISSKLTIKCALVRRLTLFPLPIPIGAEDNHSKGVVLLGRNGKRILWDEAAQGTKFTLRRIFQLI